MQLPSLTSLRFFAAALVVLSHLPLRWPPIVKEGYIGVTFFFVLSGFILSHSYANRQGLTWRKFLEARFARVYPLHALTILLAVPLAAPAALTGLEFFLQLLAQATLTHAFIPLEHYYYTFNYPSWSLSVELLFYLLFPLLVGTRSRWLLLGLAAVVVYHLLPHGLLPFSVYIFPPARLGDFVAGILAYRLFAGRAISAAQATAFQAGSLALLVAAVAASPAIAQTLRYDLYYLLPMGLVVLSFAWQNGVPARWLAHRTLVFLGECSFALYLVHQLVIRYGHLLRMKLFDAAGPLADNVFSGVYAAVALGLSALLFLYFERPAKRAVLERLNAAGPRAPTRAAPGP